MFERVLQRIGIFLVFFGFLSLVSGLWLQSAQAQGRPDVLWVAAGHGRVLSTTFSPDNQMVASGSSDGSIKLWQATNGQYIRTLAGHNNWVYSVAFSPDGQLLASGSDDRTIKIWRVADGTCIATLIDHSETMNLTLRERPRRTVARRIRG